jgi:hypothetical protein
MKQIIIPQSSKRRLIAFAEEMSNLAVQRHYGMNKTNVRWWKKQKEQLYMARRMTHCGRTMIKNSQIMTQQTR